jgi:hypothetical protein
VSFSIAVKNDGSMYFAGSSGCHVYRGSNKDELAASIASGILSGAYTGKDMKLNFRGGDVYVKTDHGKKRIKGTAAAEMVGDLDLEAFGNAVRMYIEEKLNLKSSGSLAKNEALNAAELKMTLEDYRSLIGKKEEERMRSEAQGKEAGELMDRTEAWHYRDSGYHPQPRYYRDHGNE